MVRQRFRWARWVTDTDEEGEVFPWQRSVEIEDKSEKLAKSYGSRAAKSLGIGLDLCF